MWSGWQNIAARRLKEKYITNVDSYASTHKRRLTRVDWQTATHKRRLTNVDSHASTHKRRLTRVDSQTSTHTSRFQFDEVDEVGAATENGRHEQVDEHAHPDQSALLTKRAVLSLQQL